VNRCHTADSSWGSDAGVMGAELVEWAKASGLYGQRWFAGVRVEVKAARAIDTKKRGDLVSEALGHNSAGSFWMNFQIKTRYL
jgi:hypothetical protein